MLNLPQASLGVGTLTLSSSVNSLADLVQASFTGNSSGNQLTISSVTGFIRIGATVAGSGIPAGTKLTGFLSGTNGGAGVYTTDQVTTASSASLTTTGIPAGSVSCIISLETANMRWRDDGGSPTTSVGMSMVAASAPFDYSGNLSGFKMIAVSDSPVVTVAFYGP